MLNSFTQDDAGIDAFKADVLASFFMSAVPYQRATIRTQQWRNREMEK